MKIQLIKVNKTLCKVELDDENVGVLSEKIIRSIIDNIEIRDITKLQAESIFEKIEAKSWSNLLNFISIRERSRMECFNYLKRKFVADSITKKLLLKAERYKYIDDERFCKLYSEFLFENGKSLKHIRYKLNEKGIDEIKVTNALDRLATENDNRLNGIVKKIVKRYESFSQNKQFDKVMNYLVRNGFEYYEIKEKVKFFIYKG